MEEWLDLSGKNTPNKNFSDAVEEKLYGAKTRENQRFRKDMGACLLKV
jgi:hypothetical protein